jgi:hypothetical protein
MEGELEPTLRDEHEELYGMLLLANQKISNVGTAAVWLMIVGTITVCVGIHKNWVDNIAGIDIVKLQGWGVYVLITIVTFILFSFYTGIRERGEYQRIKPEIIKYLRTQGISIYSLLAKIEDDPNLSSIAEQLKDDPSIQVSSAAGGRT